MSRLEDDMLEELREIDTSAIEELATITSEQQVLQGRLDMMQERKDKVSPEVFERVRSDYEARQAALEAKARPLKERARAEYARLAALHEQLGANLREARLAKEELDFRHDLGEFEESAYGEALAAVETRVAQCTAQLTDSDELRMRFVAAFRSEEELRLPVAEPHPKGRKARTPDVPATLAAQASAAEPVVAMPEGGPGEAGPDEVGPPEAGPPEAGPREAEMVAATPQPPAASAAVKARPGRPISPVELPPMAAGGEPIETDATFVFVKPCLESESADGRPEKHLLGTAPTSIGRSADNDICIPDPAISRRHAKVVLSENGYMICDLNSENGVFVNGQRVKQRVLANGDLVEIGPGAKRFVFYGP